MTEKSAFLVMEFLEGMWPHRRVRWLLVSQGVVGGYVCGIVTGFNATSEVRVFPSAEQCDAQITAVYEPALRDDGFVFNRKSAVVMLDPSLVLNRRGKTDWALDLFAVLDEEAPWNKKHPPEAVHWSGTRAEYDEIPAKEPGVLYTVVEG